MFVGALELFLVAALTISPSLWFLGGALLSVFSSVGLVQVSRLARREPVNATLYASLRGRRRLVHFYNLIGAVLFALLGIGSLLGWLHVRDAAQGVSTAAAIVATALPCLWMMGWFLGSSAYWRAIVAYARTGT